VIWLFDQVPVAMLATPVCSGAPNIAERVGACKACPTGEDPGANITGFFRQRLDQVRSGLRRGHGRRGARRQVVAEQVAWLTYDDILETSVAFGAAPDRADRRRSFRRVRFSLSL
jgi:hypothetical protein